MSAKIKLTDLAVQRLGPGLYWDESTSAFGLRVGKKARTFLCVRNGGQKVTIGRYPAISLQDARKKAKGILLGVFDRAEATGYVDAVERFLRQAEGEVKAKTLGEYRRILNSFNFILTEVSPGEVAGALDKIEKLSSRAHAYACLKTFFNWAMRQEYVDSNPVSRVRKPRSIPGRERVLEDHELRAIWNACDELGKYGVLVRLLIATGQRKNQFASLREDWVDWDKKRFEFPATVMKAGKGHVLPFSTLSEYVLRGVVPSGGYYFSPVSAIGQPFTAWSKSKVRLDALVNLDPFTLHDARRTWSTNAARLDIAPHIAERVLAHSAPEGRVAGIYNRYRYENEMREAMEKMSTFLMSLINE